MQKWGGLWGRFELTLAVQSLSLFPGSGPAQSVVENREEMAGSAEGRMEPRYPVCSQLLTHDFFFFPELSVSRLHMSCHLYSDTSVWIS